MKNGRAALLLAAATLGASGIGEAQAQAEPFVGQIMWVPFPYCPRGWTEANGQLLPINQYTTLFSLVGTIYGGDGRTNFALPDLRGRVAIHEGQGPGLSPYRMGQQFGAEQVALTSNEMPSHSHVVTTSSRATDNNPAGNILGSPPGGKAKLYDAPQNADTTLAPAAINESGGGQPHENRQPSVVLRACIALQGIYPSRN